MYALVYYPRLDTRRIGRFQEKYSPQFRLIEPHITLIFPLPESIGEDLLIGHLEQVLSRWEPFPIHLQGIQESPDGFFFLLVQEGSSDVTRLHDEIYTGILAAYLREDLPYIPHLTLGVIPTDSHEYTRALEEAGQLGVDQRCMLDRVHLVKVEDDRPRITWSKVFLI